MPIRKKSISALPDGEHTGHIAYAHETTKTFDKSSGPEATVELVIQPDYKSPEGFVTPEISVCFSPVLNGLSALSGLLDRLEIDVAEGGIFDPLALKGTPVSFSVTQNPNGFPRVDKDSIKKA